MIEAKERGYFVTDAGELYGPKGKMVVKLYGKQRYPTFTTNWGGCVFGIPVHQFAAFCFYGESYVNKDKNIVVRHLNGDTLDFSKNNILLGSYSDNERDKPEEVRRAAAKAARKSQGIIPSNSKLTREDVEYIRMVYLELNGRKAPNGFTQSLCNKFGVSKTVIHRIVKGVSYASYID
jgi:hypothetical protein